MNANIGFTFHVLAGILNAQWRAMETLSIEDTEKTLIACGKSDAEAVQVISDLLTGAIRFYRLETKLGGLPLLFRVTRQGDFFL